jgi:hypothetical protein
VKRGQEVRVKETDQDKRTIVVEQVSQSGDFIFGRQKNVHNDPGSWYSLKQVEKNE